MKKLNKKGFTLIELIVVIAILAILAAILIPAIINYVSQANESRDITNARSLYSQVSIEVATDATSPSYTVTGTTGSITDLPTGLTSCTFEVVSKQVEDYTCVRSAGGTITAPDFEVSP